MLHVGEVVGQGEAGQVVILQVQAGQLEAVEAPATFQRQPAQAAPGVDDRANRPVPLVWPRRVGPGPFMQVAAQGVQALLQVAQALAGRTHVMQVFVLLFIAQPVGDFRIGGVGEHAAIACRQCAGLARVRGQGLQGAATTQPALGCTLQRALPPKPLCQFLPVLIDPGQHTLTQYAAVCLRDTEGFALQPWQCLFHGAAQVCITRGRGRAFAQVGLITFARFDHPAQDTGLVTADVIQPWAIRAAGAQFQAQVVRPAGHGIERAEQQAFTVGAGLRRLQHAFQCTYQRQFAVNLFDLLANRCRQLCVLLPGE
ncbi:hypothetical protein D3C76_630230 [compost metagenome]